MAASGGCVVIAGLQVGASGAASTGTTLASSPASVSLPCAASTTGASICLIVPVRQVCVVKSQR